MFFSDYCLTGEVGLRNKWFVLNDYCETWQFTSMTMLHDSCDCQQLQSEVVQCMSVAWLQDICDSQQIQSSAVLEVVTA